MSAHIEAHPEGFRFEQILRLALLWRARPEGAALDAALREAVRLRTSNTTRTAGAEVAKVRGLDPVEAPDAPAEIELQFAGLYGPNGVMDPAWTHAILAREHQQDRSLRDFFDTLQQRSLAARYALLENTRPDLGVERARRAGRDDDLVPLVRLALAIAGVAHASSPTREHLDPGALLAAIPHSRGAARTRHGLRNLLEDAFGVPVAIDEFVGQWIETRTEADAMTPRLGRDTRLGTRSFDAAAGIRIAIGPLDLATYRSFLPSAPSTNTSPSPFVRLKAWIRAQVDPSLTVWLQPILAAASIPTGHLSAGEEPSMQLGQTSFLGAQGHPQDFAAAPTFLMGHRPADSAS